MIRSYVIAAVVLVGLAIASGIGATPPAVDPSTGRLQQLPAVRSTSAVQGDADDCAIWVHPRTSSPLGPDFPTGLLVKHDAPGKRFALYAWPPEPRVGCTDPEGGWPDRLER